MDEFGVQLQTLADKTSGKAAGMTRLQRVLAGCYLCTEMAAVQATRYARGHFDIDRYQMLQSDARRLERLLRRID